jgi:hypothetical protein
MRVVVLGPLSQLSAFAPPSPADLRHLSAFMISLGPWLHIDKSTQNSNNSAAVNFLALGLVYG